MEQLLIVEDDIGLNQGLSKALKADDRQIISCQDLKTAKEQLLCGGVNKTSCPSMASISSRIIASIFWQMRFNGVNCE